MPSVRRFDRPVLATLAASLLTLGSVGCGGEDDGGAVRVPDLTRSFGDVAYDFVTQQSDGGLTKIVLHSDGRRAVMLILKDGVVDRAQSARVVGTVRDAATLQADEGQVNVDGNVTFADNDVVGARGFVVVADQEIATTDLDVGDVVPLEYTFRAILAGTEDASALGSLLDPG